MNALEMVQPEYIAGACFIIVWIFQMYVVWTYGEIARIARRKHESLRNREPLTIVIPAHDQAETLRHTLPVILEQDYPTFEVIVVDIASTDETTDVLQALEERYPRLRHTFVPRGTRHGSPERVALTIAFKAAANDRIILTVPGSRPRSAQWLQAMSDAFTTDTDIVLGYANYSDNIPHRQLFFRFYHQMQNLTHAATQGAYRCTPANLGYRKSFFLAHKGFADDFNLPGDATELLVNRHSTPRNTSITATPEAGVIIDVPHTETIKEDNNFYMETRKHFRHTFIYRLRFNFRQIMPLLLLLSWCTFNIMAVMSRQWLTPVTTTAACITLIIWQSVTFSNSCRALGEQTFGLRLAPLLILLPIRHLAIMIHHAISPQRPRKHNH